MGFILWVVNHVVVVSAFICERLNLGVLVRRRCPKKSSKPWQALLPRESSNFPRVRSDVLHSQT